MTVPPRSNKPVLSAVDVKEIGRGLSRHNILGLCRILRGATFLVRPAWAYSNGCKSLSHPDSGKATAKDKGVRGDAESEGSRRQTSALMYKNMI